MDTGSCYTLKSPRAEIMLDESKYVSPSVDVACNFSIYFVIRPLALQLEAQTHRCIVESIATPNRWGELTFSELKSRRGFPSSTAWGFDSAFIFPFFVEEKFFKTYHYFNKSVERVPDLFLRIKRTWKVTNSYLAHSSCRYISPNYLMALP